MQYTQPSTQKGESREGRRWEAQIEVGVGKGRVCGVEVEGGYSNVR